MFVLTVDLFDSYRVYNCRIEGDDQGS